MIRTGSSSPPRPASRGILRFARALATLATLASAPLPAGGQADDARRARIAFADLAGWGEDDHAAAFAAFRHTCRAIEMGEAAVQSGAPVADELVSACLASAALYAPNRLNARHFFEAWFEPIEVGAAGRSGFLTGYYEPELPGARLRDEVHTVPLLAPPPDHAALEAGSAPSGLGGLTAARRTPAGLVPYPDRAAIEAGALDGEAEPVAWLSDPVDAFVAQVQGSARIRLAGGGILRVGFAGRNGHPYTAVGRVLAEALGVSPATMTADRVYDWLRAHPAEASGIMRRNRSYIFFRPVEVPQDGGPLGAAGAPLAPGRSLAIDRGRWSYGLPVWLEADLPAPDGSTTPFRRLVVAQDTGAAITGAGRGDLFFGSGPEAGAAAALVRHPVRWVVLAPKGRGGGTAPLP